VIADLPPREAAWLGAFFAAPNELTWAMLEADAAPALTAQVRPWLEELVRTPETATVVLPLVRERAPIGWYAATANPRSSDALTSELRAWLGPSYLARFDLAPAGIRDARVRALRSRFAGGVLLLSGATAADNATIAERLIALANLRRLRPPARREIPRPVGRIRADFDRALLAQNEHRATALLAELRSTGRLNEENLRYLEVRLQAGLGYWPQLARNPWLITTLSDLRLPPQTLADLVEALYRTFLEPLEASGDPDQLLHAFETAIARPYPRLFASRRGVRVPRVVKAFLLFERLRPQPTAAIIAELRNLLPESDRRSPLFAALSADIASRPAAPESAGEVEADAAFDDGEVDRAFELYMAAPMGRKTLNRLLLCGDQIGLDGRQRLLTRLDSVDPSLLAGLSAPQQRRLAELRAATARAPASTPQNAWIAWAQQLRQGRDLTAAERAVGEAPVTWDIAEFYASEALSSQFAELIGNLSGEAAAIARQSVAALIAAFFPPAFPPAAALRPIAAMLFLLLAMDDPLSHADLDLLAQLVGHRLALGLTATDYAEMVRDLCDVWARIASYANLPWSLDLCEALALAPATGAAQEARLGFFMAMLDKAQGMSHRLQPPDLIAVDLLAKDFHVESAALGWLQQVRTEAEASGGPNLAGKRIGIYTLAEAAGARAKAALEAMYPGCRVEVNSDLVCSTQLASLADGADLFVFAWKSSSHQAFYCVKEAMAPREPVWASGKGTASILRAVADGFS